MQIWVRSANSAISAWTNPGPFCSLGPTSSITGRFTNKEWLVTHCEDTKCVGLKIAVEGYVSSIIGRFFPSGVDDIAGTGKESIMSSWRVVYPVKLRCGYIGTLYKSCLWEDDSYVAAPSLYFRETQLSGWVCLLGILLEAGKLIREIRTAASFSRCTSLACEEWVVASPYQEAPSKAFPLLL